MVFQSFPIYPDPPNSWPQGSTCETPQVPPPQPLSHGGGGGGSASSIKPGSMAERARLAKIPQPEAALKCPRCESSNTKFCYFNNYSLSQPRHFCKACRRYWTRGGALRNVPVGGGWRRNKRSKGNSRSKSPAKAAGSSSSCGLDSNSCPNDIIGHMAPPPLQVPILPPLQSLVDYNSTDIGLNFTRIQPSTTVNGGGMEFNAGTTNSSSGGGGGGVGTILSNGLVEQWRWQQIPLQANLELQSGQGLYQFEGQGIDHHHSQNFVGQHRSKPMNTVPAQLSTVKMEANQGLNLSMNFLGIAGNEQYWGSNAWSAELPGFTSASTSNLL